MGALLDILRGQVGAGVQLDLLGPRTGKRMTKGASYASGRGRQAIALDPRLTGYSASAVAYRCVHYIASNAAGVDLAVLQGDEPNPDHEIAQLWNRRPNPVLSARSQKELVFARLELTGEQMLYLDRGPTGLGPITDMWPIYDPVEIVVDQRLAGELLGYVVKAQGRRIPLLPSEVLWLRYPHPFEEWGALAPWKAALFATEVDAYARAWQRGEFANGGRPSSVVYLGDLDDEAHDAAVAEFRTSVEGPENAGKSLLVSGPTQARVDRLTLTPAEMSYLESRVANADEVMLAFGLRPDLFRGQATYENQRAAKVAAWSDTILPKLEVCASETDRQLLPDLAETAVFDVSAVEALRENADALWKRIGQAAGENILLLDEARAELGYDPMPGGRGNMTAAEHQAAIAAATSGSLPSTGRLLPGRQRIRLYVGPQGLRSSVLRVPTPGAEPEVRRARTGPKVLAFYDRHERIGHRAVGRLARKQERVVLQRLRQLVRTQGLPQLLASWAEAADLPGVRIASSDWTELPVAWRASGVGGVEQEVRVSAADLLDNDYWRGVTVDYLDAFMAGVWEGGAANVADTLGISLDLFDTRVIDAMRTRADVLADQVTKTTRHVLDAQLLQAGVEGGESIDQLTDRIRAVYADLEGWRATAIARTETVGGFNASSRLGAIASGVVNSRTWLAAHDDRVRESHAAMDGETVTGLAGVYSNGLLYPGDPTAPPSETVNCRCVETYGTD